MSDINIWVYSDWHMNHGPQLMGNLLSQKIRGKEIFSFEFDQNWIENFSNTIILDPFLRNYSGKQFAPDEKPNFGLFLDSSPDRWGRVLMKRRESIFAKKEQRIEKKLFESDFLMGVFDQHRMGAIRFKSEKNGEFQNNNKEFATPPWSSLRELENASLQLEIADKHDTPDYNKWLFMLLQPGSSLGGARPKASVVDQNNALWIAKFPSLNDRRNIAAWELVLNQLALSCKIEVPEARLLKLSSHNNTYLSKRFDRTSANQRIHYASAMTLLGHSDGDNHLDGTSYLDIAGLIIQNGNNVKVNLEQLWRRICFNILVSNTDDHLRNHGFLLTQNGWNLAPAFDMNPNEFGHGLTLNISENSNDLDLQLAMQTAKYYQLSETKANDILKEMRIQISQWSQIAKSVGIKQQEIQDMSSAFLS